MARDLFSWQSSRAHRDKGMSDAVDHANRVQPGWSDCARAALIEYATRAREPFLAEDCRAWANDFGKVPAPPDERAWGWVIQSAFIAGDLRRVGFAPARSSRMGPKPLWVRNWSRPLPRRKRPVNKV